MLLHYLQLLSLFITGVYHSSYDQNHIPEFNNNPAPHVEITRDDLVATLKLDFNESSGWGGQLWNVGTDGTDPCGYLVEWWPDGSIIGSLTDQMKYTTIQGLDSTVIASTDHPFRMVTPNLMIQLQPIANNVPYHLRAYKINGLGQICSPANQLTFDGGDSTRVTNLRNSMTFFDDFNLPMGPADELKWNNATAPQTDPRFNLFFINPQYHTHTLNGTLNGAAGDKSQVAQRARKSILIEENVRRKIVFDMDGIFSPRSIWYLDLNPIKTDLTGHMSFFDFDGDTGLPADVLRLRAEGHNISVNLINSQGASYHIASAHLPDFGRAMAPNVRRAFDVSVGIDGITIKVDGIVVIDASFDMGTFKSGIYDLLWTTVGYNTSKDDNPYFLSHWDNFGFDGPDVEPFFIHNYVTRIAGTDLQKASSWNGSHPVFHIEVPDDIRPTSPEAINEVFLVFTYMKNDYSTFSIGPDDYFTFNGVQIPLPQGANNSSPEVPELIDYSGSAISNRLKIGEASYGQPSPLIEGINEFQFFAENTGIMNVHIEVLCPDHVPPPPYTPPSEIHPFVLHGDLPKLGLPAKITFIDGEDIYSNDQDLILGPEVSDTMEIDILVGNNHWASWGPQLLNMPAQSPEIWSTGSTAGIEKVNLYIRRKGNNSTPGSLVATLETNQDAPSPQLRYRFNIDTKAYENGVYEVFLQAFDSKGIKSHPAYHGFAFNWDASEISGAYWPVEITVNNAFNGPYVFSGTQGSQWEDSANWQDGSIPPHRYNGTIYINENCVVPTGHNLKPGQGGEIIIQEGKSMTIK
jgi:hypothetical protein